ncbi:MAG: hypothetical protein WCV50_01125 [Patescibacteria group bacterium]|jgi:hypothetical protein
MITQKTYSAYQPKEFVDGIFNKRQNKPAGRYQWSRFKAELLRKPKVDGLDIALEELMYAENVYIPRKK